MGLGATPLADTPGRGSERISGALDASSVGSTPSSADSVRTADLETLLRTLNVRGGGDSARGAGGRAAVSRSGSAAPRAAAGGRSPGALAGGRSPDPVRRLDLSSPWSQTGDRGGEHAGDEAGEGGRARPSFGRGSGRFRSPLASSLSPSPARARALVSPSPSPSSALGASSVAGSPAAGWLEAAEPESAAAACDRASQTLPPPSRSASPDGAFRDATETPERAHDDVISYAYQVSPHEKSVLKVVDRRGGGCEGHVRDARTAAVSPSPLPPTPPIGPIVAPSPLPPTPPIGPSTAPSPLPPTPPIAPPTASPRLPPTPLLPFSASPLGLPPTPLLATASPSPLPPTPLLAASPSPGSLARPSSGRVRSFGSLARPSRAPSTALSESSESDGAFLSPASTVVLSPYRASPGEGERRGGGSPSPADGLASSLSKLGVEPQNPGEVVGETSPHEERVEVSSPVPSPPHIAAVPVSSPSHIAAVPVSSPSHIAAVPGPSSPPLSSSSPPCVAFSIPPPSSSFRGSSSDASLSDSDWAAGSPRALADGARRRRRAVLSSSDDEPDAPAPGAERRETPQRPDGERTELPSGPGDVASPAPFGSPCAEASSSPARLASRRSSPSPAAAGASLLSLSEALSLASSQLPGTLADVTSSSPSSSSSSSSSSTFSSSSSTSSSSPSSSEYVPSSGSDSEAAELDAEADVEQRPRRRSASRGTSRARPGPGVGVESPPQRPASTPSTPTIAPSSSSTPFSSSPSSASSDPSYDPREAPSGSSSSSSSSPSSSAPAGPRPPPADPTPYPSVLSALPPPRRRRRGPGPLGGGVPGGPSSPPPPGKGSLPLPPASSPASSFPSSRVPSSGVLLSTHADVWGVADGLGEDGSWGFYGEGDGKPSGSQRGGRRGASGERGRGLPVPPPATDLSPPPRSGTVADLERRLREAQLYTGSMFRHDDDAGDEAMSGHPRDGEGDGGRDGTAIMTSGRGPRGKGGNGPNAHLPGEEKRGEGRGRTGTGPGPGTGPSPSSPWSLFTAPLPDSSSSAFPAPLPAVGGGDRARAPEPPVEGPSDGTTPRPLRGGRGSKAPERPAPPPPLSAVAFRRRRERLTAETYASLNELAFGGALPPDLAVTWNASLATTAGLTRFKRVRYQPGQKAAGAREKDANGPSAPSSSSSPPPRSPPPLPPPPSSLPLETIGRATYLRCATIELSSKVIDSIPKLRSTLCHEMCHAAAWIVDAQARPPHGPVWKAWAARAAARVPDVQVTRCHSYEVFYAHRWRCRRDACGAQFGRHTNSVDVAASVCGRCGGRLEYLGRFDKATNRAATPKELTGFPRFVQERFAAVKRDAPRGTPHRDLMRRLATEWKEHKAVEAVGKAVAGNGGGDGTRDAAVTATGAGSGKGKEKGKGRGGETEGEGEGEKKGGKGKAETEGGKTVTKKSGQRGGRAANASSPSPSSSRSPSVAKKLFAAEDEGIESGSPLELFADGFADRSDENDPKLLNVPSHLNDPKRPDTPSLSKSSLSTPVGSIAGARPTPPTGLVTFSRAGVRDVLGQTPAQGRATGLDGFNERAPTSNESDDCIDLTQDSPGSVRKSKGDIEDRFGSLGLV